MLTAYYRMETLELLVKIHSCTSTSGAKEIDEANINRLIELRKFYGVTGKHPVLQDYRKNLLKEYSDRPKKIIPKRFSKER